jgi:hypothetical protein
VAKKDAHLTVARKEKKARKGLEIRDTPYISHHLPHMPSN